MNKDSNVYKMILLGVLCGVCGLLLAVVNSITAPVIADNQLAKVKDNLEVIFPGGDFKDVSDTYLSDDESGLIDAIYTAKGEGTIFTVHGTGYNSSIGAEVFSDDFASKYKGVGTSDEIPMKSGATLTSNAVKSGIQAAQKMLSVVKD